MEEKGEIPNFNVSFDEAKPTTTHTVLTALEQLGLVK